MGGRGPREAFDPPVQLGYARVVSAVVLGALLNVLVMVLGLLSLRNAARQRTDVRRVVKERQEMEPTSGRDPWVIMTKVEIDSLSSAQHGSWVYGTRLFGPGYPDPWSRDLDVARRLWPVYANRLHENAMLATIATDLLVLGSAAFGGVAATDWVTSFSRHQPPSTSATFFLLGTVLVASVATLARVTMVADWNAAATRYRDLDGAVEHARSKATERRRGASRNFDHIRRRGIGDDDRGTR